jgi:hypothetical protein
MVSQNNNNNNNNLMNQVQNATTNNSSNSSNSKESKIDLSGEFDKLADVVKTKSQSQPLSRERATAAAKAATPTPTLNRQSFTEGSSGDKKAEKTFDVASKDPTTNIFSGDGQQVSIENSGETSQLVEQKILDGPAMVDGAPSIVPDGEIEQPGEPENPDEDAAPGAPSIVPDVITDNDRKDRFASETGQKELAKMLTVVNIKQLLPSDIDYILGIGPLLSTDGEELAPTNDMSKEPEYAIAAQVVAGYISTLSDDEKNDANVLKWQKHLGLL